MIIALASVGFAAALNVQAATLRCGSQLVSTGDHLFEVERKCGTPASQAIVGTQETFNNTYRKSEQVQIEEWIYGPDHGMYQYLRFIGGRLTEITSKRGN
jgi:hypothetical protein